MFVQLQNNQQRTLMQKRKHKPHCEFQCKCLQFIWWKFAKIWLKYGRSVWFCLKNSHKIRCKFERYFSYRIRVYRKNARTHNCCFDSPGSESKWSWCENTRTTHVQFVAVGPVVIYIHIFILEILIRKFANSSQFDKETFWEVSECIRVE